MWNEQTLKYHPYLDTEWAMGDGAYKSCPHVITKYIEGSIEGGFTAAHHEYNRQFNSVRQRVEHIISHIKNRPMFRQPWRCTFRNGWAPSVSGTAESAWTLRIVIQRLTATAAPTSTHTCFRHLGTPRSNALPRAAAAAARVLRRSMAESG